MLLLIATAATVAAHPGRTAADGCRTTNCAKWNVAANKRVGSARSGLCGASLPVRTRFAPRPRQLTLATPHLNRHEKVLRGTLPSGCRSSTAAGSEVRQEYALTIDRREMPCWRGASEQPTEEV